ncbi:MAG: 3-deoxy-8-phosphooctulonate synthase [Ignavibacteria bacterium]|nr:3-deoxy-8-phosphooctulonate synthase [Ignavibacteria bacterium]
MIELNNIKIGGGNPFVLIAGPCVIENRDMIFSTAERIKKITTRLQIPYIFKSSYKKANRTSLESFAGIGDEEGLRILSDVKKEFDLPVLTDVHSINEADDASQCVDILQIPAFLSRQTELLVSAGRTGKVVNIKKGQFLSPYDMEYAANKVKSTGNNKIMLTERGTTFGYNNLVVDMRSLVIMKSFGYPVVMDATHSVQIPSAGGKSGGQREFILPLAKAAAAIGVDVLYLEVHPNPKEALSDADSQLPLSELENLLTQIKRIDDLAKSFN